jgi:hypothetical protein
VFRLGWYVKDTLRVAEEEEMQPTGEFTSTEDGDTPFVTTHTNRGSKKLDGAREKTTVITGGGPNALYEMFSAVTLAETAIRTDAITPEWSSSTHSVGDVDTDVRMTSKVELGPEPPSQNTLMEIVCDALSEMLAALGMIEHPSAFA